MVATLAKGVVPWWGAIAENTKIGLCYLGSMLQYFCYIFLKLGSL